MDLPSDVEEITGEEARALFPGVNLLCPCRIGVDNRGQLICFSTLVPQVKWYWDTDLKYWVRL